MEESDQLPIRRRNRLVDDLASQLRNMIVEGKLRPGELLPSQKDLAARYGVGLSTVHEAVQVLAAVGLVTSRPGKGTWVREDSLSHFIHPDAIRARLGELQVERLFEARALIEVWLTEAATLRRSSKDLAAICAALDAMKANQDRPDAFVAADLEFHTAVAVAGGNDLLQQFYHLSRTLLEEVIEGMIQLPGVPGESIRIQEEIARAIKRRDPIAARQAAEEHMRYIARLLNIEGEAGSCRSSPLSTAGSG